jgi:hypothetical protein
MPEAGIASGVPDSLCRVIDRTAIVVPLRSLVSGRRIPRKIGWRPDVCIRAGDRNILVHALSEPEAGGPLTVDLPARVSQEGRKLQQNDDKCEILVLAATGRSESGDRLAGMVAGQCAAAGFGLAFANETGTFLVFPARHKFKKQCASDDETGHVPSWLLTRLSQVTGFSPYLTQRIATFVQEYLAATAGKSIAYDRECEVLQKLAAGIARGDRRLFIELDRLHLLKTWERSNANPTGRDHFFHTFNNLLLGYLLLGQLKQETNGEWAVDSYIIGDNGVVPKLQPWEVLWFLTSMFHDSGYVGERFWSTVRFNYGLPAGEQGDDAEPIPDVVVKRILNAWQTVFAEARTDLCDLYSTIVEKWLPPSVRKKGVHFFDSALQRAYYDGRKSGHSLLSGLMLIQACRSDSTTPRKAYRKEMALAACEIAALAMIFHDRHCRLALSESGVPPIPFEQLPYAAVLMYVDCLQDDRRDIRSSRFRKHGVLQDVAFDSTGKRVRSTVCLREVPVERWPARIAEYESALRWINAKSKRKFAIDYFRSVGLQAGA